MSRFAQSFMLCVGGLVLLASQPAHAKEFSIPVMESSLATLEATDTTLADFFVLTCAPPVGLTNATLHRAFLEFYINVDARVVNDFQNDSPILEVYALTSEMDAGFDVERIRKPSSMRINVPLGQQRFVRLDVTEVLRWWLEDSERNQGLVIGSLSNSRDGIFTVREGDIADGAVARLRVFTK